MGMLACYMEADKYLLADLLSKQPDERLDTIEDLEEGGEHQVLNLDKMWDGLHCLLTGVSASSPIENNPYSEAAIGTKIFSEEDTEFIAYIRPDSLPKIVNALDSFDLERALENFEPQNFEQKKIYPNIWQQNQKNLLTEELRIAFTDLKKFYHQLAAHNKGVIISIY